MSARVRRRRTLAMTLAACLGVSVVSCTGGHRGALQGPAAAARTSSVGSPPGRGPRRSPTSVYQHDGVRMFASSTRSVPYRLYVPESAGRGVDVLDANTGRLLGHYRTGLDPQHVVPSYDLKTLWSTNDLANSLTPFDPGTGKPRGPSVPVNDPYNMYFLPGGKLALVVQEQLQQLGLYDAQTMDPVGVVKVDCAGVDHADFTQDERVMVASCEFGHRLLRFDVASRRVLSYLDLPGSSPQDVRLTPDGRFFLVADKKLAGVHVIDARRFVQTRFVHTGPDAHGIYPSRDGTLMYISNRGNGTISVLDPGTLRVRHTWHLPGGGSPDMGGVSPDGRSLWLTGRYDAAVYQMSTTDGRLLRKIHVPRKPHGMCVWPQPGRYSLGHTGNMR